MSVISKISNIGGKKKFIAIGVSIVGFILALLLFVYLKVLPWVVNNSAFINCVESGFKKTFGAELVIDSPKLYTSLSPYVKVWVKKISLTKGQDELFVLDNLNASVSWAKLLWHKVELDKLGADYIFVDVPELIKLFPVQQKNAKTPSSMEVEWLDSLFVIKKFLILCDVNSEIKAKIEGNGISVADKQNPKFVRFNIVADLLKENESIRFGLNDNNTVFIKDKKLHIENGILSVNDSKVFIDFESDAKNNFDMTVFSDDFELANIVSLIGTNLLIPNGSEILTFFNDVKGNFDFKINVTNNGTNGKIILNNGYLELVPFANLPVVASNGQIDITNDEIKLSGFSGYYGKNTKNKVALVGSIKDYTKSVDTNIEITGKATNELVEDYLSKLVGVPITLTADSGMRLVIKSIYDKIDILWQGKIAKGNDILVDGASLSPVDYDRAVTADLHFEDNILNIKSINYYIASVLDKNTKGIKPILTIDGNLNMSKNGEIMNIGFAIPKPLPSEFLNVLIGQKMFKGGTIAGDLQYVNTGKFPILDGQILLNKIRIPSQRLSVRNGSLNASKSSIKLNANGRFKRSSYDFNGDIKNNLLFPIVIKDVNLTVDNVDVERLMTSMNNQNTQQVSNISDVSNQVADENDENADDAFTFDTGLLIVERCVLNVVKGFYKDIKFGNLFANLTLNKDGVLEVKSNRFEFAEGISTLKVFCDLKNHDYRIRLGVKDINSDLIATNLLALKKEISGKANGLIMLNTDASMKLNGEIKFSVKNGTIGKVGLVEYVLKFASLFRNPLAMISPSTLVDLVNIPEGNFDNIYGELLLKNNIIEKIMIKSSASQLSSFIVGKFNLETRDATLRIYTKFSNANRGFAGFLRNISLNSLANRIPLSSRNDSNYYESELKQLPPIDADEKDCQVFLTKVDGEVETGNFISSLRKIK